MYKISAIMTEPTCVFGHLGKFLEFPLLTLLQAQSQVLAPRANLINYRG